MGRRGKNFRWSGGGNTVAVPPPPPAGPQYYAANAVGGTGSGLDAANPCLIGSAWAKMSADAAAGLGPTLNLADGTYTGANSMIVPTISGTASALVVVKATNEGNVLIDGQTARIPVKSNQKDYINLIGVNACNSNSDVYQIQGSIGWYIQRCCGWDAPIDFNALIFACNYGIQNVFEDCAGWGNCRKVYISYANAGPTIFRRMWSRWTRSTQVGPKLGGSLAYNSYNVTFENCISTWDQTLEPATYTLQDNGAAYPQGALPVGGACNVVPLPVGVVQADHSCLVNSNFVQDSYAPFSADSNTFSGLAWSAAATYPAAPRTQAVVSYGGNAYYSLQNGNINHQPNLTIGVWWNLIGPVQSTSSEMLGCIAYQKSTYSTDGPARLIFTSNIDLVTIQDCVAIFPDVPGFSPTTPRGTTRQPFLLGAGTTGTGQIATNLTSFHGQASASAYNATWVRTNVKETTTPAAFYPGAQSLYSNDGAHGATIRYRTVNGILTSTALFPWPMSARILAATTSSGYDPEDVDATIQGFFGTYI